MVEREREPIIGISSSEMPVDSSIKELYIKDEKWKIKCRVITLQQVLEALLYNGREDRDGMSLPHS